jgi:hypothetical protein
MKLCTTCKQPKANSEFNKHQKRKDGLQTVCKACNRERAKRYYEENKSRHKGVCRALQKKYLAERQAQIVTYLKEHPCVSCGEKDPVVLDFDHTKGNKKHNVSSMVKLGFSWGNILLEIASPVR